MNMANTANTTVIWQAALERLETAPIDAVCKTWLHAANLTQAAVSADDIDAASLNTQDEEALYFTLQVPSALARDVINTRWRRLIEDVLAEVTAQTVAIVVTNNLDESFTSRSEQRTSRYTPSHDFAYYDIPPRSSMPQEPYDGDPAYDGASAYDRLTEEWDNEQRANIMMHNRLNPRYTFDAFIVGNSNRLAHAASLAVAEAPGESYNPLFLYGGVGLGKTHLLHAIGHKGIEAGLTVLYVSSEQFTNEIINAIRYRTTEEFRAKYRSVDILLVDDIQFIAGKESTEEEFFHTFNSLYEMSKQIVICSDRPPKAIVSLEERLRSRFEWGLIADIQPPDLETRMAILRVKADALHYPIPDEIIAYIASRIQTNIRELEGSLNRLMAYQHLHQAELTMDVARAAMSSLGNDARESRLSIKQIAQAVADYYHVSLDTMCSKQRDKHIVMPRQIAMYLMRQETQASLLEIGQLFGGRDHSTVLHACEKIDRAVNINPALRREIVAIREQLLRE
ncbi:MAG TPA: chromosomal replication initiator protein DnaA [Ktedonobacteraceae bacterium]|jgi:chromosomal replication initiator protein|nr:chromosomal replication initiator protein DnaA [Ktedonobacteraceae bacterium]